MKLRPPLKGLRLRMRLRLKLLLLPPLKLLLPSRLLLRPSKGFVMKKPPKGGFFYGGRGGIRTHGGVSPTPVFKTGALNHSTTRPCCQGFIDCLSGKATFELSLLLKPRFISVFYGSVFEGV